MLPDGGDQPLDLVGRVAPLAAEGSDVGDDALVGPASDGLRGHAEAEGYVSPIQKVAMGRAWDGRFGLHDRFVFISGIDRFDGRDAYSSHSPLLCAHWRDPWEWAPR
jgi:hypothetical protein